MSSTREYASQTWNYVKLQSFAHPLARFRLLFSDLRADISQMFALKQTINLKHDFQDTCEAFNCSVWFIMTRRKLKPIRMISFLTRLQCLIFLDNGNIKTTRTPQLDINMKFEIALQLVFVSRGAKFCISWLGFEHLTTLLKKLHWWWHWL